MLFAGARPDFFRRFAAHRSRAFSAKKPFCTCSSRLRRVGGLALSLFGHERRRCGVAVIQ